MIGGNPPLPLREVVSRLSEFDPDDVICVRDPRATGETPSIVMASSAEGGVPPAGWHYLLEVFLAQDVLETWSAWRDGRVPTAEEGVRAIAYYADNDAYLPVDED